MTADAAVYLDHNATAPLRPQAAAAMRALLDDVGLGNPSSVHRHGRRARACVEDAREAVAALLGAPAAQVVFTGGGSEANGLALTGPEPNPGPRLCSAVEHDSVRAWVPGVGHLPVDRRGVLDLDALADALRAAPAPGLLSLMLANNETGVRQPVADAVGLAHAAGWRVHVDAVQAPGRIWPLADAVAGADLVTLSAHKMGGPAGVGALVVADDLTLAPLVRGGGQERGRRAGTENVIGLAGFAAAARAVVDAGAAETTRLAALQARLEAGLVAARPDATIYGAEAPRLPNTTCIGLPDRRADLLVMSLDLAGVSVGAGSACSSGKLAPSPVLAAMGLDETAARSAIRLSLGWSSTAAEVDRAVAAWATQAARGR